MPLPWLSTSSALYGAVYLMWVLQIKEYAENFREFREKPWDWLELKNKYRTDLQENVFILLKRRLKGCPATLSKWIPHSRKNIIQVILKQQAKLLEDPMTGTWHHAKSTLQARFQSWLWICEEDMQ